MLEVTVRKNDRKWGWEFSTTPTGHGTEIEVPNKPFYEGTLSQIAAKKNADKTFQSVVSGGTFYAAAWFYDGHLIEEMYTMEPTAVDENGHWLGSEMRWGDFNMRYLDWGGEEGGLRLRLAE